MRYELIEAFSVPDSWRKVVSSILHNGDTFIVKSGSECTETKKLALTVRIRSPHQRPLIDDKCITTNMERVQAYTLEYLWTDSCHFKEGEEYTYGSRLRVPVDQIQDAINLLVKEPNNRQITMTIRIPHDIRSPHPPCLTMIDLEVLEQKLNLYGYFRSWDAYAGYPENTAGLQLFAEAIVKEVNDKILEEKRYTARSEMFLDTGEIILHSKNCHLYQRQYEWAEKLELSGEDSRRMSKLAE